MRRYSQVSRHVAEYSDLPFWKKVGTMELVYVAYGLLVVTLVVASYILGATNLLPHDPQEMDLQLLMAPQGLPATCSVRIS